MGKILDISILPRRAKQMGETLAKEGEFALRSELGKLMRIARVARPGALYDASVSAQTSETIAESIIGGWAIFLLDRAPTVSSARTVIRKGYAPTLLVDFSTVEGEFPPIFENSLLSVGNYCLIRQVS